MTSCEETHSRLLSCRLRKFGLSENTERMSKPSLKSVKETEIKGMDREFDILGNQERDTKTDEINTVSTDREFSNNATTTELVNKSVDPKEFASVEQTDKSTIEVRTEEIMHDVDKTLDAPTVQVSMAFEIKNGLDSGALGSELTNQFFNRSRSDEHLEEKFWKVKKKRLDLRSNLSVAFMNVDLSKLEHHFVVMHAPSEFRMFSYEILVYRLDSSCFFFLQNIELNLQQEPDL